MTSILKINPFRFQTKILFGCCLLLFFYGCDEELQNEQVNEITVYYTFSVTQAQAQQLGAYLSLGKNAEPCVLYLDKNEHGFIIKRVVKTEKDTSNYSSYPRKLSRDLFKKQPVIFHLVDEQHNSIKKFTSH
ncbi:MAG: hypothetical protein KJO41_00960 [Bacteroidia bacterium]|nr:hypothetical protein [Bacteroidia bacterium]MBT8277540.1 hypothetical protein [Bacteroidia bacterium]NNK60393.1 hypothetical protein [Flavobacteriaceae bacterium]NNL33205.1 hypothetical protein [Flavobacteriaceae bacterium]